MDRFVPIHQHMLVRTYAEFGNVREEDGKRFLTDLVHAIGMVPVTEPQCVVVRDPGNEGPTGSINLATSHIAFHHWVETGLLMVDVYSCKSFDPGIVMEEISKVFGPLRDTDVKLFDRMS